MRKRLLVLSLAFVLVAGCAILPFLQKAQALLCNWSVAEKVEAAKVYGFLSSTYGIDLPAQLKENIALALSYADMVKSGVCLTMGQLELMISVYDQIFGLAKTTRMSMAAPASLPNLRARLK